MTEVIDARELSDEDYMGLMDELTGYDDPECYPADKVDVIGVYPDKAGRNWLFFAVPGINSSCVAIRYREEEQAIELVPRRVRHTEFVKETDKSPRPGEYAATYILTWEKRTEADIPIRPVEWSRHGILVMVAEFPFNPAKKVYVK